jgi:hypothetical protein
MATTIASAFQQLKTNLEITGLQKSTVSTRQTTVRDVVGRDLKVKGSFLTGSYSRSTMISPLKEADVDIFIVLDSDYYYHYNGQNGGQAGLLDLLKRTLRKTYTRTPDISRNGQAVTIRFEDFMVDVVPGFDRQGGGYLIPNSITQSWIATDPKKHVEIISNSNLAHKDNFVPLIKMIKGWNKNISGHFRSFHLEVLALQILEGVTISNFPSGMRYFFDKGRDLITKKNQDPAGYGGDVGGYIDTPERIQDAVNKLQQAHERAIKAEYYESIGLTKDSIETWGKIFGDYFPSYG